MSIWGVLTGVSVGAVTGNPALGAAASAAVSAATTPKTACPGQKTQELAWLMAIISGPDRQSWLSAAGAGPGGKGYWAAAINGNDAASLAFHLAGGSDCKVTTTEGKAFVTFTLNLLNRYESMTGLPQTPTVTVPQQPNIFTSAVESGAAAATRTVAEGTGTRPKIFGLDPLLVGALAIAAVLLLTR